MVVSFFRQIVCTSSVTSQKGLLIDLETVYRSFLVVLKCVQLCAM